MEIPRCGASGALAEVENHDQVLELHATLRSALRAGRIPGVPELVPALRHQHVRELPTEATVTGALQVPRAGQPILFLADHPVTGGYPVIGVVHPDDLPLAAQARPGQRIRFKPHNPAQS